MRIGTTAEARLVASWQAGDRTAGDRLLRNYAPQLERFFRSRTAANVDELVQRTLLACTQSIKRYQGRSTFRSYLLGIAHNQLLMSVRAATKRAQVLQLLAREPAPAQQPASEARDQRRTLVRALVRVSPEYQHVLKLFYWDDCSVEEIADRLAVPAGTVKSRLARGRACLREQMTGS